MEKYASALPKTTTKANKRWRILLALACLSLLPTFTLLARTPSTQPAHAAATLARCQSLLQPAGPPKDFHERKESDRFAPGTKPTLIKNARIWTGLHNGTHVVDGDILLDRGLIAAVGHLSRAELEAYSELEVVDAKGAWVTPGIVDIHSHLGDGPSPALEGAVDDNSLKGTAQPWLRSLDGLNTHDDAYPLSIAGGVTTALVLPGSANAIGTHRTSFLLFDLRWNRWSGISHQASPHPRTFSIFHVVGTAFYNQFFVS